MHFALSCLHTPLAFIGLVGSLRASYDLELGG